MKSLLEVQTGFFYIFVKTWLVVIDVALDLHPTKTPIKYTRTAIEIDNGPSFVGKYGKRSKDINPEKL